MATHNEKVLALLSDGKPHSHHELYGLHLIGHSRVADLRAKGHRIEQWRDGDSYWYQLLGGAGEPGAGSPVSPSGCANGEPPVGDSQPLDSSQLSLDVLRAEDALAAAGQSAFGPWDRSRPPWA